MILLEKGLENLSLDKAYFKTFHFQTTADKKLSRNNPLYNNFSSLVLGQPSMERYFAAFILNLLCEKLYTVGLAMTQYNAMYFLERIINLSCNSISRTTYVLLSPLIAFTIIALV